MSDSRIDELPAHAASLPVVAGRTPAGTILAARCRKRFAGQPQEFVLDVEFNAAAGFTILFGASGAGKTTLLDCVAGLAVPDYGRISIGDRVLFDAAQRINVPVSKRRVGYVFQSLALFPHRTVEQNIRFGLAHLTPAERASRTSAILEAFRIPHLARRYSREISGGEKQRTALARTLVTDPAVLLLDEPLAALDAITKAKIIDDLRTWNLAHRIPILYVTHSREEVFALGENLLVLDAGKIVAQGTPHEVIEAPQQETVAQLVGFENVFDAVVEAVRPERGTMTCRIAGRRRTGPARNAAGARRRGHGPARGNPRRRHSARDIGSGWAERAQHPSGPHHGTRAARCNRLGAGEVQNRDGGSPHHGRTRFAKVGAGPGGVASD